MSRVANMIAGRNRGCKRTGATQRATPPRRSTAGEGRVSVRSSHREQRTLSNETTITPPKGAQDFVGDAHIPLGDPPGTIFVRAWSQPVVQGLVPDCGSSDPRTRMIREAYEFFRWELAKGEQPPGPVRSSAVELIREVADGLLRIVRGRSAAELDAGWMLDQAANAEWNEDVFEQHAEYRRNGPDGTCSSGIGLPAGYVTTPDASRRCCCAGRTRERTGILKAVAGGKQPSGPSSTVCCACARRARG
jgi:hypothetical protein